MTDRIVIRGLRLRTRVGVRDWEKEKPQDVLLDLTLHYDRAAGRTDRLEDAVDYKRVKDRVVAVVEGASYALLEALAEKVAAACLSFEGVERVTVEAHKPNALRFADTVGIIIERP